MSNSMLDRVAQALHMGTRMYRSMGAYGVVYVIYRLNMWVINRIRVDIMNVIRPCILVCNAYAIRLSSVVRMTHYYIWCQVNRKTPRLGYVLVPFPICTTRTKWSFLFEINYLYNLLILFTLWWEGHPKKESVSQRVHTI